MQNTKSCRLVKTKRKKEEDTTQQVKNRKEKKNVRLEAAGRLIVNGHRE